MPINSKKNKRIAIRADASIEIGIGHIMRCMVFAKEMQKREKEIYFISRKLPTKLSRKIKESGFHLISLPDHQLESLHKGPKESHLLSSDFENKSWHLDLTDTIDAVNRIQPYLLLIDHFGIDEKWEKDIRNIFSFKIAVIDGQRNRKHDCDILIDPNYSLDGSAGWRDLVPPQCELFVGPQFAFLRTEFFEELKTLKHRDGSVKNLLICFGGADKCNATEMVLEALKEANLTKLEVHVIIGEQNPWRENLTKICRKMNNFNCYINPDNVASLLANSDLAIGSGGIMTWERCVLGVPSIIMPIAENEVRNCQVLSRSNVIIYIGRREDNNVDSVKNALLSAVADPLLLKRLSRQSINIMRGSKTFNRDRLFEVLSR